MKLKAPLTLCCVALLAGCMGSKKPSEPPITRYQSLVNSGNSIIDKWFNTNTTPENMPSGTFSYSGVAAFSETTNLTLDPRVVFDSAILVSDIDMTVDFNQSTITGELSNFVNDRDHTLSGSVPLSGTIIYDTSISLLGEAGTLVSSHDNSESDLSNFYIQGAFYGQNANAALGSGGAYYGGTPVTSAIAAER